MDEETATQLLDELPIDPAELNLDLLDAYSSELNKLDQFADFDNGRDFDYPKINIPQVNFTDVNNLDDFSSQLNSFESTLNQGQPSAGNLTLNSTAYEDTVLLGPGMIGFPICALVCAILCICLPMRITMQNIAKQWAAKQDDAEDQTEYREKAVQFSDCYDVSNPLTSKKGKMRLLDLQIEDLENQGEDGAVQAQILREQKDMVSTQDSRAAMQ